MKISSIALPTVAAKRATIFVALELSRPSWLVALHSPVAGKVGQHRFAGGDVAGLPGLIARKQKQAQSKLGQTIRVLSCYEAGHHGFWFRRLLCARGIDDRVLDAASILVERRSRRAKTDRLDAVGLPRTLLALDRGKARSAGWFGCRARRRGMREAAAVSAPPPAPSRRTAIAIRFAGAWCARR